MSLLELKNVHTYYGHIHALKVGVDEHMRRHACIAHPLVHGAQQVRPPRQPLVVAHEVRRPASPRVISRRANTPA